MCLENEIHLKKNQDILIGYAGCRYNPIIDCFSPYFYFSFSDKVYHKGEKYLAIHETDHAIASKENTEYLGFHGFYREESAKMWLDYNTQLDEIENAVNWDRDIFCIVKC